jgi:hypothetical protein
MESFSRGWAFLKQAWQMVLADKDLIKPSIITLFVGFGISIIFIIPMAAASFLLGGNENVIGQIILFVLGALLVFSQFSVSYIFSSMTIYLIYGYLSEGDGRMDKAWAIVKRDWLDILSLAAASTFVNIIKGAVKGKGNQGGRNFLAGLIDTVWTEAAFLILPAMVIEDINLKDGLKRAGNIVKNNLLLVGISTVGVKAVTGLISFLLGTTGILLGFGIGFGIVSVAGPSSTIGWISAISLGVIAASIFIIVASVAATYTSTAYHTCLYLWARDVEKAQASGSNAQIAPPAPLAAVLNR